MYDPHNKGQVEDFTDAFLATFGVIVFMALATLWVVIGFLPTLGLSWLAGRGLAMARNTP